MSKVEYVVNNEVNRNYIFLSTLCNRYNETERFICNFEEYSITPLIECKYLADRLKIGRLYVKDESERFGLTSFKGIGLLGLIGRLMAEKLGVDLNVDYFCSEEVKMKTGDLKFTSVYNGYFSEALIWILKKFNLNHIIYLPANIKNEVLEYIINSGIEYKISEDNYYETVKKVKILAEVNKWIFLSDSSEEIRDEFYLGIMEGYSIVAYEIINSLDTVIPTHIFLQGKYRFFAAIIADVIKEYYKDESPYIILVEEKGEGTFYNLIKDKKDYKLEVVNIKGKNKEKDINSIVNDSLLNNVHLFISVEDEVTINGVRRFAMPLGTDKKIMSGGVGAVTMGTLLQIQHNKDLRKNLKLDLNSKVVVINTEGYIN